MELRQLVQERETSDPDPDLWRWSPLELAEFARMLAVARDLAEAASIRLRGESGEVRPITFGEAGSGIGTKLYLARHHFGLSEMGYEIDERYLVKSQELGVHAVRCDLRELTPPWVKFDIVYLARPFKDDSVEAEWERSVMDAMRPGAVLISAFAAVKPYTWDCYYRKPFRGVWVKSQSGYHSLIQRSTTGPDPLVPQPGPR